MFSKMQSSAAASAVMISFLAPKSKAQIAPPPQFDYASSLSCAKCIQGGYEYVYDNGAEANTQFYKDVTDYSGFCCTKIKDVVDCNDTTMWDTWTAAVNDNTLKEAFTTALSDYYNTAGNGKVKTGIIVREFYSQLKVITDTALRKDWFVFKSNDITVTNKLASYKKDNLEAS